MARVITYAKSNGDWCVRVQDPDGASGLTDEVVSFQTRAGKSVSEKLGEPVEVISHEEVIYAKAQRPQRTVQVTEVGVYELPDGRIYAVRQFTNKATGEDILYARRMVEITAQRATEAGTRVEIEFVKAPGAIFEILPEHRMDPERAKELSIRYGRCIMCGRRLKAAKSVEDGIGPVCSKRLGITSMTQVKQDNEIEQMLLDLEPQTNGL